MVVSLLVARPSENRFAGLALLAKRATAGGVKMDMETMPGSHNSALPGEIEQSIRFFESVAA